MKNFFEERLNENPLVKSPYELVLEEENRQLKMELALLRATDEGRFDRYENPQILTVPDPIEPLRVVAQVNATHKPNYPEAGYHAVLRSEDGFHMTYQVSKELLIRNPDNAFHRVLSDMHINVLRHMAGHIKQTYR